MSKRAVWVCGLCGALSGGCTNSASGSPDASPGTSPGPEAGGPDAPTGVSTGPEAGSLVGTWNLTTTEMGGGAGVLTTVTIGQDSLSITSPSFTLTATRTGNVLAFTDNAPPNFPASAAVLTATQTAANFNAGILPFDLGGSWTMQAGPKGGSATVTCTLTVSATEIDGACQNVSPAGPWFNFTTRKTSPTASSLGDFGGTWTNAWTWAGTMGGTYPCALEFTGNSITTCDGGATDFNGSPLAGITFTYDGANTVSGAAQGWAEYSATR
ncbi:MAG: hypothetical protein ACLP1X_25750 [Polyangiaceae bacterium]|jgi:hypothetical protein